MNASFWNSNSKLALIRSVASKKLFALIIGKKLLALIVAELTISASHWKNMVGSRTYFKQTRFVIGSKN